MYIDEINNINYHKECEECKNIYNKAYEIIISHTLSIILCEKCLHALKTNIELILLNIGKD